MSSAPTKVSFGFKPPATAASKPISRAGPSTAFGASAEEDDNDNGPTENRSASSSEPAHSRNTGNTPGLLGRSGSAFTAPASKASRAQADAALSTDASAFDYDSVYDSMKSSQREVQQAKQHERSKREAKYVTGMLESQKERNKLLLRAQAKKVQRERDAEGAEFAGGEEFVTDAYREQQEELRKVEEEERLEEERQSKDKKGLSRFYSNLMDEEEELHRKAVEASAKVSSAAQGENAGPGDLGLDQEASRTDAAAHAELAKEARAKGLDVQLNDEGQLVDQRSVLATGLNVLARKKNTAQPSEAQGRGERGPRARETGQDKVSARDGAAQARRLRDEARERSSRAIEDQILELERTKDEARAREEEERKRKFVGERRNDADKVAEAKKRMEERKRRKLEEAQQQRQASDA
ncbi:unnamed protein product [Parajaminaea phylloscopi]